jgi:hypothetical protein
MAICFNFFIFNILEFFINSRSCETLNTKIPLISSLEDGFYVHKLTSFPTNSHPKKAGAIHTLFGARFGLSQKSLEDGLRSALADFIIN